MLTKTTFSFKRIQDYVTTVFLNIRIKTYFSLETTERNGTCNITRPKLFTHTDPYTHHGICFKRGFGKKKGLCVCNSRNVLQIPYQITSLKMPNISP